MNERSINEGARTLARLTGTAMLGAAAVVVAVLLLIFGQVLFTPEAIPAVQAMLDFLSSEAPLFIAKNGDKVSSLEIAPGARLILVYFIGGFLLLALGSVLHGLIGGGLSLLKFAEKKQPAA